MRRMVQYLMDHNCDEIKNVKFIFNIWSSAPLHDIGKVSIPDNILLKKGKLTEEELIIMKTHPLVGFQVLNKGNTSGKFDNLMHAKDIALYHHEKYDGSGYPYGIKGKEIPLSARIMAIIDVYDALRSKRPYKDAFTHEKSVAIIIEGSGKHFDPDLVSAFLDLQEEFRRIFEENMD